jgi:tetratricopeptide (TPR) repeat protein
LPFALTTLNIMIALFSISLLLITPSAPPQQTSGPCSPVIANVVGNVTVTCIGVAPQALDALNQQLQQRKLDSSSALRDANLWTQRYLNLEKNFREYKGDRKLAALAETYLHQGDLDKAGEILDQILKKDVVDEHWVAASHYDLAMIFELQWQPLKALPHLKKAYEFYPENFLYANEYMHELINENHFDDAFIILETVSPKVKAAAEKNPTFLRPLALVQAKYALLYFQFRRYPEAETAFQEALDTEQRLAQDDPSFQQDLEKLSRSMGDLYAATQRWSMAQQAYQRALEIGRRLEAAHPGSYLRDIAETQERLATFYSAVGKSAEAEEAFQSDVKFNRDLVAKNPVAYRGDLAVSLHNIGLFYARAQKFDAAEKALSESVTLFEASREYSDAYLPNLAGALTTLALLEDERRKPDAADEHYSRALTIYNSFDDARKTAFAPQIAQTLLHRGDFHRGVGIFLAAETEYNDALSLFLLISDQNPSVYLPEIAHTHYALALLYLDTKQVSKADDSINQALQVLRQIRKDDPQSSTNHLAAALLTKSEVLLRQHAPCSDRQELLQEARQISSDDDLKQSIETALKETQNCSSNKAPSP